MERTNRKQLRYIIVLTIALGMLAMVTEGCRGKKCGCMHDLNGVYKTKRHRNW